MAIRTRTTEGYQQVELTSELLHRQSGSTQQVISTIPCRKHLPFFAAIILADILLFGAILLFTFQAVQYGSGFGVERQVNEAPNKQSNLYVLIMLTAIYFNGQATIASKSNYMVKHKSVTMLYKFLLNLLTACCIVGGVYSAYGAQDSNDNNDKNRPFVSHFCSVHALTAIVTIALFTVQFVADFFSFFVNVCCKKFTARVKSQVIPLNKTLTLVVLSLSVSTAISGLNQLARFDYSNAPDEQLSGQASNLTTPTNITTITTSLTATTTTKYQELKWPTILINLTAMCVLASMILIFFIKFTFKRRQAHDLPVIFKLILLVAHFIELLLLLFVAEYIFQVVTPHVNKVMSGELLTNTTITHFINNATQTLNTFITNAKDQITNLASLNSTTTTPTATRESSGGFFGFLG